MKFSQRIGKKAVRDTLQIESIDQPLANKLWNNFLNDFVSDVEHFQSRNQNQELDIILRNIWDDFFENRADEIPKYNTGEISTGEVLYYIKKQFFKSEWYEKYDFIEFISAIDNYLHYTEFTKKCNETLEKESSGYRIIENTIVQLTSENEIQSIEEAIDFSSKIKPVEIHLKAALHFYSNRENPDYRNSIKESISAVESLCSIITGNPKVTLGDALSQIEKSHKIHGALKKAFNALYGYTSDHGGIRHALTQDDILVTSEEAKFMLVSCSAFINYLKVFI